jgi:PAP2 superfamily protein
MAAETDPDTLRRLDRSIWALVAMIAVIVLAAPFVSSFYIEWRSLGPQIAASMALCAGAWFYRHWRRDQRLEAGLECTAQLVAFTAVGAPLSYLAAAAGAAFPLQDPMYEAIDRALGLDWKGMLAWMNEHTVWHSAFRLSYMSFTLQASMTVLTLAFIGELVRLRIFMLALALSALVCIAISVVLPAQGIWGFYNLTAADYPAIIPATRELHLPIFHGLRDGSFRALTGLGSEGIIVFPSFHAALAVIFMVALWPVPVLRWFGVVVNVLMIVATPIDGGHYFIDVPGGIVVAVLCLAAAHTMAVRAGHAPSSLAASKIPQLAARD